MPCFLEEIERSYVSNIVRLITNFGKFRTHVASNKVCVVRKYHPHCECSKNLLLGCWRSNSPHRNRVNCVNHSPCLFCTYLPCCGTETDVEAGTSSLKLHIHKNYWLLVQASFLDLGGFGRHYDQDLLGRITASSKSTLSHSEHCIASKL